MSMVFTTLFFFGSMTDTVPSPWFAAHTSPTATATPSGRRPTSMVFTTAFVAGSILETD